MSRTGTSQEPEPIESASADAVAAVALGRLQKSLQHTYERVAPYRKACEAAGVHPDDLRSLDDLARFPFTTKADLRADQPFGRFAVPREELARIHASSGTTGLATVVGYTAADLAMWAGLMARCMRAAGARPGISPTATGCSPAVWARTRARRRWAARWCPRPAVRRSVRSS
jgi:phenylacetate-CoA ligase